MVIKSIYLPLRLHNQNILEATIRIQKVRTLFFYFYKKHRFESPTKININNLITVLTKFKEEAQHAQKTQKKNITSNISK